MRKRATDMDERDWWLELDARINVANSNGFKTVELAFDETKAIIKLLQELDNTRDLFGEEGSTF